ncbi:MAG: zinc metalloprotease HtpX [Rhodospirillales bacterium]|nr:zinc metalloprotease HtpX [Rhodospirillales bacterium]
MEKTKTLALMTALVLIFMWVGNLFAGSTGMTVAFYAALATNFISYFFSDKMVLAHYNAIEVDAKTSPLLYDIVSRLAHRAGLPMPRVYIIPEQVPNAFATGRNPSHAAVAATQGLVDLMTPQEIEGVLAHEMSHVRHYDILISTIAAVFAGAIVMIGNIARSSLAGRSGNGRAKGLGVLIATVLMPVAATIIRMSISRSREFRADEGAAHLTEHPEWLMSALAKLDDYANGNRIANATSQTAHMFIMNPLTATEAMSRLFSTHPSTAQRLARLENIRLGRPAEE